MNRIRLQTIVAICVAVLFLSKEAPADRLWAVGGQYGDSVYRVDPADGTATSMWSLPGAYPYGGLAFGNGYLWAVGGQYGDQVYRVNPADGSATSMWSLPGAYPYGGLAYGNGYLWAVGGQYGDQVYRVNPADGTATSMWSLPGAYPYKGLTYGNGYLWAVGGQYGDHVYRVDPSDGSATSMWSLPGAYPYGGLAYGNGLLWAVGGQYGDSVYRVDPADGNATSMWSLPGAYRYGGLEYQDTTPPAGSVIIEAGRSYASSTWITLSMTATDAGSGVYQMRFSNDSSNWAAWESYATSKAWMMDGGDGTKIVYAQFRDIDGNVSEAYSDSINLDTMPPQSRVTSPQGIVTTSAFMLEWAVSDLGDFPSGVQAIEVFWRKDEAAFGSLGVFPATVASTVFNADAYGGDRIFGFYTVASDVAGNVEPAPGAADVLIQVYTAGVSLSEMRDFILGNASLPPEKQAAADFNKDGRIDIADIVLKIKMGN